MSTSRNKKKSSSLNYHHGDLAQALKRKALAIIKSKGLAGLNLRDLAKKCEVSSSAVYRHYQSKEHLLAIIAEEGLDELQTHMMVAQEPKRLQKMGLAYIQFALNNPLRFRLGLESAIDKNKFPDLLKKHHQTYEIVKLEVKRCVENGTMVGDVDGLTCTAWATVHGTAMLLMEGQFPNVVSENDAMKAAIGIMSIVGRGLGRVD